MGLPGIDHKYSPHENWCWPLLNPEPQTRNPKPQHLNPKATKTEISGSGRRRKTSNSATDFSPSTKTRKPKPETWNPKPETWNLKPETRNLKLATRNPKPETRNPNPRTETRSSKPCTWNQWSHGGLRGFWLPRNFVGYATKFAQHDALKFITWVKVTIDEWFMVHRVGTQAQDSTVGPKRRRPSSEASLLITLGVCSNSFPYPSSVTVFSHHFQ